MKKYVQPKSEVVRLCTECAILAGSGGTHSSIGVNDEYSPNDGRSAKSPWSSSNWNE